MKLATLKDAPEVLNTNDKAMWVLGHNAAVEAMNPQFGLPTLSNVIDCLRSEGRYVDEEGEATDRLQDLFDALSLPPAPSGYLCADCKSALRPGWTCDRCGSSAAEDA